MRRLTIGRVIGVAFLATVVSLLSIDTAQACRFLWRFRNACAPVICCPPVEVVDVVSTCCPTPVDCTVSTCSPCPTVCEVPTCSPCASTCGDVLVVDGCTMASSCEPIVEPYPAEPMEVEPEPAVEEAAPDECPPSRKRRRWKKRWRKIF